MRLLDFFRKPEAESEHRDPVWELVEAGRYEEARRLHQETGRREDGHERHFLLRDGDLLCYLGEFEVATQDYIKADAIECVAAPGSRCLDRIGIAQWLAGHPDRAIQTLETCVAGLESDRINYARAFGGSDVGLLLFALSALEENPNSRARAIDFISQLLPGVKPFDWPAPLCRFVIGRIEFPQLLGESSGRRNLKPAVRLARKHPLTCRQVTQALSYGGVRSYEDRDRTTALDLFETCVGLNAIIEDEWLLARALCQRLGPS